MISYRSSLEQITPEHLDGFFVDWPQPPSSATLYRLLQQSTHFLLAVEQTTGCVIGYITALSDGVLFAFISSLEVLPAYQQQGIGSELMRRMMDQLADLYALNVVCDAEVQTFYARFGMRPISALCLRRYDKLSGKEPGKIRQRNTL